MIKQSRILIVDDDPAICSLLVNKLERMDCAIESCNSGERVLEMMEKKFDFDLIILDVMLPGIDGTDLLVKIKHEYSDCQIIIMTAYPSVKMGVAAIKQGAFDFICKPFDIRQLLQLVRNALENHRLKQENCILRQNLKPPTGFSDLVGKSEKTNDIRVLIRQAAASRATVLITGESGTGKEVVAKTIHKNSKLHESPFVVVNCGAIPESLIESELFGYEKGAFTGAEKKTKGKFEQAENGTIFLDEISELPQNAQVKLLRVLQEKEITRLAGTESIPLNIRVIAATNRSLVDLIQEGSFREDLYYRVAVFLIDLPSLKERNGDVLLLARHFLGKYLLLEERPKAKFSKKAENILIKNSWPGNVRELENCIYRTVLMTKDKDTIDDEDLRFLPPVIQNSDEKRNGSDLNEVIPLRILEAKAIEDALKINQGNVVKTSRQLEISRVTLYRKMKEYNIEKNSSSTTIQSQT